MRMGGPRRLGVVLAAVGFGLGAWLVAGPARSQPPADESAGLQARIDEAFRTGSCVVELAPRVYPVANTLRMRSGVTLRGVRPSPATKSGTWLRWAGDGPGPVLDFDACQDTTVVGLGLDGAGKKVTAVRLRSRNRPSSWGLIFREFAVTEVEDGFRWGDPEFPEGQADHVTLEDFSVWNCSGYGIVVDSWNSAAYSEIRRGQFFNCVKGHIDLRKSGFVTIASCAAGGQNPSPFLAVHGQSNNVLVQSCQSEKQSHFLYVDGADDRMHVQLQSCTINDPVEVKGIARVLGLGNYVTSTVDLAHRGAVWVGLEDRFGTGEGAKLKGVGRFVNQRAPFAGADDPGAGRGELLLNGPDAPPKAPGP